VVDASKPARPAWPEVPRGALRAWLWLNLPASAFADYVCDWGSSGTWCHPAWPVLSFVTRMFPEPLSLAFPELVPKPVVWIFLILATLGIDTLLRRWAPPRLGLLRFVLIAASWELLTWASFFGALMMMWLWSTLGVH